MKKHIPNMITSLSVVSGTIAIFAAISGLIQISIYCIAFSAICDFLDGFAARALGAYSELGKQLDSLADMVAFGVAPMFLAFSVLSNILYGDTLNLSDLLTQTNSYLFIPLLAIPVCSALRLAKFNISDDQTVNFKGVPTPATAIVVIGYALIFLYGGESILRSIFTSPYVLIAIITGYSLLMTSSLDIISLKFNKSDKQLNRVRYIFLAISLLLLLTGTYAVILIMLAHILVSLAFIRK